MITKIKNLINSILFKLGYRISKTNNSNELVKLYKYKNYEEYKETQIFYNKQKINHVWADELHKFIQQHNLLDRPSSYSAA